MNSVNRRKARPGANNPGFFTGMKPNFVSKALALPINVVGNAATYFENRKELKKPENLGNSHNSWDRQKTTVPINTHISTDKGMVPTSNKLVPRPAFHSFDLLSGGKQTTHSIDLESTYDLTNVIPHEKWKHDARVAAKAANDEKISSAGNFGPIAFPYQKTPDSPAPEHLRPESMVKYPYDPYRRK